MRPIQSSTRAIVLLSVLLVPIMTADRASAQQSITPIQGGVARIGEQGTQASTRPAFTSATPLLEEGQRRLARLMAQGGIAAGELTTAASVDYEVGDVVDFWAVDFSKSLSFPYKQYEVEAECRAVGDYAYYFVESEELVVVGSAALDEFISAFEIAAANSPRDSEKGIYEHVTEVFGDVPDVDQDDRIVILLTNIPLQATAAAGTSFFSGYFYSANQFADPVDFGGGVKQNSNETELLYVNSRMVGFEDPDNQDITTYYRNLVKGTIAHEFQHLIQFENDPDEIFAINEGLSEYAAYITGFGLRSSAWYVARPNVDLLSWRQYGSVSADYARSALWTFYLGTRFGDTYIRTLSTEAGSGITGLESSLSVQGLPDFGTVYNDFITALYLEGGNLGDVTYDMAPVTAWIEPQVHENLYPSTAQVELEPRGAIVLRYWNVSDLDLSFPDGLPTGVTASVAMKNPGGTWDVSSLTGLGGSVTGMGTTWSEAAVILTNGTGNTTDLFQVEADGIQDMEGLARYETGLVNGLFTLSEYSQAGTRITPEVAPAKITAVWIFTRGDSDLDISIRTMVENSGTPGTWIVDETPIYSGTVSPRFQKEGWTRVPVPDPGFYSTTGQNFLISVVTSDHEFGYVDLNQRLGRSFIRPTSSGAWTPLENYGTGDPRVPLLGDWMIRAEFTYLDDTAPTVGVGLIQHPLFPSQVEVYLTGDEPLHHGLSTGTWTPVGGSATDLLFEATLSGVALVDPTPVILQSGQVDLSVEGFDRYGGLSDTDAATVTVAQLGAGAPAMLISRGRSGTVIVDVPPGSHRGSTLMLIPYDSIPVGLPGAPDIEESVLGTPLISLGPSDWQGPSGGSRLSLPVHGFAREGEEFHFERWSGSAWEDVPGQVVIERGAASGSIAGGGWYRLARGRAPIGVSDPGVELLGNAPNPFNPRTVISYRIPGTSVGERVRLTVLNVRGQVVQTLVDGVAGSGTHTVVWEGDDASGRQVATGIYLYRLKVGRTVITRKMLLLR
ncbi:FlgD immunoglobulin-like domain containing protein [Gemmatimonadota bacterium]